MESKDLAILGSFIFACTIISIFASSFLVLSQIPRQIESIMRTSVLPKAMLCLERYHLETGYPRNMVSGKILEVPSPEKPDRIVIEAQLFRINPNLGTAKITVHLKEYTQFFTQKVHTGENELASLNDMKKGDYVTVRLEEDPVIDGKLQKESFTATRIIIHLYN